MRRKNISDRGWQGSSCVSTSQHSTSRHSTSRRLGRAAKAGKTGAALVGSAGLILAGFAVAGPPAGAATTSTWSHLAAPGAAGAPPVGMGSAMAFDGALNQNVLFGGFSNPNNNATTGGSSFGGTWTWNGSAWSPLAVTGNAPPPRSFTQTAYDPGTQQLVLFGGQGGTGNQTFLGSTYTLTGNNWNLVYSGSFTDIPTVTPSKRAYGAIAYDPATSQLVLFGGQSSAAPFGGTWTWNGTAWTKLNPSLSPAARYGASIAFDPSLNELVLFGGTNGTPGGSFGGTWAWTGTTWTKLTPINSPTARFGASMAYDPALGELVLFGGTNVVGTPPTLSYPMNGGTWAFNGTTWTKLTPSNSPAARYAAAMDYDSATGQTLLFGGSYNAGQSTSLTYAGGTWAFRTAQVPDSTTTSFTSSDVSPASPVGGKPVTFTASVQSPAGGTPAGTVTFDGMSAGSTVSSPLCQATLTSSGTASCSASLVSSGSPYSVTATYSGNGSFAGSTSSPPVTVSVQAPATAPAAPGVATTPTTTTFTSSFVTPSTSSSSSATTFSAVVRAASTGSTGSTSSATPTGTVTFEATPRGSSSASPICQASLSPSPSPSPAGSPSGSASGSCSIALNAVGSPYSVVAAYSGDATFAGSTSSPPVTVTVAAAPSQGYREVASDGGIFAFGNAGFYGSMGAKPLNKPIVGIASTPDGKGYWEVASDGGIFAFGDAGFYGSMGAKPLNKPIVGIASTPDGKGYWEVASDGGIFAFGDAGFYGSMGAKPLNKPIVGIASTPDGKGYWEVASDGGIFAFGDAGFYGSMGAKPLSKPIVGIAP